MQQWADPMDDYGNDLFEIWAEDLRLLERADWSMTAYGFMPSGWRLHSAYYQQDV